MIKKVRMMTIQGKGFACGLEAVWKGDFWKVQPVLIDTPNHCKEYDWLVEGMPKWCDLTNTDMNKFRDKMMKDIRQVDECYPRVFQHHTWFYGAIGYVTVEPDNPCSDWHVTELATGKTFNCYDLENELYWQYKEVHPKGKDVDFDQWANQHPELIKEMFEANGLPVKDKRYFLHENIYELIKKAIDLSEGSAI